MAVDMDLLVCGGSSGSIKGLQPKAPAPRRDLGDHSHDVLPTYTSAPHTTCEPPLFGEALHGDGKRMTRARFTSSGLSRLVSDMPCYTRSR